MDLNHAAIDVKEWADRVFPNRTDASMFMKLYEEVAELVKAGHDPEKIAPEIGDILILILDYAKRHGVNPSVAFQRKFNIVQQRQWVPTPHGTFQHVKND